MNRDGTGAPSIRQSKAKKRGRRPMITYALRGGRLQLNLRKIPRVNIYPFCQHPDRKAQCCPYIFTKGSKTGTIFHNSEKHSRFMIPWRRRWAVFC